MGNKQAFFALVSMVFLGCVAPVEVDESAETNSAVMEGKNMGLVPVGPAPGGPFSTILCPDDGNPATAEDIRRAVSSLLRNDQLQGVDITALQNDKVDRAGDTMTDTLTVNASTTNEYGVRANGTGSGGGVRGVGGSSSGPGGVFLGGTNGNAIEATGNGTGFAAVLGGTASTATVPTLMLQVQSGGIQMTATSPNANVDPGANHTIWPQTMVSSSITFETDGAGNVMVSSNGFNVGSVTIFADNKTLIISFARNLLSTGYRPHFGEFGPYKAVITSRSTNQYTIEVLDLATSTYLNVSTNSVVIAATTIGF